MSLVLIRGNFHYVSISHLSDINLSPFLRLLETVRMPKLFFETIFGISRNSFGLKLWFVGLKLSFAIFAMKVVIMFWIISILVLGLSY